MSHRICNIHVATSSLPIQRLLARHTSTSNSYSSRGSRGLPRHTIMWNSLGSTWKSRSDSREHWKGAPPFVSRQCFPNTLEFLTQEAEQSITTLVDAHNGFNELSRLAMLWTVRHRWPVGARFSFNCYRHWAQLLLRQPREMPVTILSR